MTRLEIATQILASYSTRDGVTDGDIRAAYDAADALLAAAEKPRTLNDCNVVTPPAEKPAENPAPDPKPLGTDFAQSFDARDWATAFVQYVERNPSIATDVDTMRGWFANAIMRGYDERARRAEKPAEAAPVVTGDIQFDPQGHAISPTTGKPTHIDPDGWFGFANKERAGVYVEARGLESSRRAVRAMRDAGLAAVRAEAAPVAPALPWVVRRKTDGLVLARCELRIDADRIRDGYNHGYADVMEVAPAAAPTVDVTDPAPVPGYGSPFAPPAAPTVAAVVPVKFDAKGDAGGDGWTAWSSPAPAVQVVIDLRPGEDAGETVAKMLAACGRMA